MPNILLKYALLFCLLLTFSAQNLASNNIKKTQPMPKHKYTNQLIKEKSPYLLQHAHNPVNWYAWDETALAEAKKQNKPIFLSVGYSTCHWCHVMERESFENEEIAAFLNQHFISIKVDREQRPDIDHIYMLSVQLTTGSGGWPMSVFLTPELKPFFGGTYFPPKQFLSILNKVNELYREKPQLVTEQANEIMEVLLSILSKQKTQERIAETLPESSFNKILSYHNDLSGGFSESLKFPQEIWLLWMLDKYQRHADPTLLKKIKTTLDAMQNGGFFDQIGGGFHRYSTDPDWLVPHFEKMLYNQALLSRVYTQAYYLTKNPTYRETALSTLNYVLQQMKHPEGAFYTAEDADSEGEEGTFYSWSIEDFNNIVNEKDKTILTEYFGVIRSGNFEGKNILHLNDSKSVFIKNNQLKTIEFNQLLKENKKRLFQARQQRIRPSRDEKIITSWNALMISSLCHAYLVFKDKQYLTAAIDATKYFLKINPQFQHNIFHNSPSQPAQLEDYAYFSLAFIDLYSATQDEKWLIQAKTLTDKMIHLFADKDGGFYMNLTTDIPNQLRIKDYSDDVIPAANAVAAQVMHQLFKITGNNRFSLKTDELLANASSAINENPIEHAYLLNVLENIHQGKTGNIRTVAKGNVTINVEQTKPQQFQFNLSIKAGWHINSHQPLQQNVIATSIKIADSDFQINNIHYPKAETLQLAYSPTKLSLYQNNIVINFQLLALTKSKPLAPIQLTLQACNNEICLAPETLSFNLPITH
ncbi:MAG: thioredoxin domain-containing protein [Methylococcales bacterium]|nr:thioredoxin domain-containing protein [Methylococcales bacterium]